LAVAEHLHPDGMQVRRKDRIDVDPAVDQGEPHGSVDHVDLQLSQLRGRTFGEVGADTCQHHDERVNGGPRVVRAGGKNTNRTSLEAGDVRLVNELGRGTLDVDNVARVVPLARARRWPSGNCEDARSSPMTMNVAI